MSGVLSDAELAKRMFQYTGTNHNAGTDKFLAGMAKATNEASAGTLSAAPVVLAVAAPSVPLGRVLTEGTGITFVDEGEGKRLIVNTAAEWGSPVIDDTIHTSASSGFTLWLPTTFDLSALGAAKTYAVRIDVYAVTNTNAVLTFSNRETISNVSGSWHILTKINLSYDYYGKDGGFPGSANATLDVGSQGPTIMSVLANGNGADATDWWCTVWLKQTSR